MTAVLGSEKSYGSSNGLFFNKNQVQCVFGRKIFTGPSIELSSLNCESKAYRWATIAEVSILYCSVGGV